MTELIGFTNAINSKHFLFNIMALVDYIIVILIKNIGLEEHVN